MKHSEVKNRIIETASYLFYKNGYNSTGINEIISEAEIAKATLYNNFKSKEEICLAYLKHKDSDFIKEIKSFASSKSRGKDQLLALFDFLELFFLSKDFNGCWCIKTIAEIPLDNEVIRKEIQDQKNKFINLIEGIVIDNLDELQIENTKSLARKIYLLYESAVSESHLHQNKWPIQEARMLCSQIIR